METGVDTAPTFNHRKYKSSYFIIHVHLLSLFFWVFFLFLFLFCTFLLSMPPEIPYLINELIHWYNIIDLKLISSVWSVNQPYRWSDWGHLYYDYYINSLWLIYYFCNIFQLNSIITCYVCVQLIKFLYIVHWTYWILDFI